MEENSSEVTLISFIVAMLIVVPYILYYGLILKIMWNWFMPVIFGLPTLTFCQALGVSVVKSVIFYRIPSAEEEEDDFGTSLKKLAKLIVYPLLPLLLGLIIKQFV